MALYDAGQSVAHLSMQAHALALHTHQMSGFDMVAAAATFGLPDRITPIVVVAVGRLASVADLPSPLDERERAGRTRHELDVLLLPTRPRSDGADVRRAA